MLTGRLVFPVALLLCIAMPMYSGCAQCCGHASACGSSCGFCDWVAGKCPKTSETPCKAPKPCNTPCGQSQANGSVSDLPPSASPGDCFTKVLVPAQYKTVVERDCIKEASERIEVIPAQYKWVEERVMTKEASKQFVEVPAVYKWEEHNVCVKPAHTGWVLERKNCGADKPRDVYCLVTTPAEYKTIRSQVLVTPACVHEETIPAQYETIRRQVVAVPASTRRICIPAEYADHERTVLVCAATIKWERVVCEEKMTTDTVNQVKTALAAAGFTPGPMDGKLAGADWEALAKFQQKNGLGVGDLTYSTLQRLGVSLK